LHIQDALKKLEALQHFWWWRQRMQIEWRIALLESSHLVLSTQVDPLCLGIVLTAQCSLHDAAAG
jgi:hypothetical protein